MAGPVAIDRATEADVAAAVTRFPWVDAVYALVLSDAASEHPDRLSFAIVLRPYGIDELVKTHYAVLEATGDYEPTGRILYVDGATASPLPLARARRIILDPEEREATNLRIAERKRRADRAKGRDVEVLRLREIERALRRLIENASREIDAAHPVAPGSPYRGLGGSPITVTLNGLAVEIVTDPFPPPPGPRLLIVDDDPTTAEALGGLDGVEIVSVHDGWSAVDRLTDAAIDFDLVLCTVMLGEFSGARIHRMVAKARPEMARRIVFVAREDVVAHAPPSSASGRVLARPVDPKAVLALLKR